MPFTKRYFVQSLVDIGQVALEKNIFKYCQWIFTILQLSPQDPSLEKKLNPLHPKMLCAKFGWNWLSGSGEDENVKSQQWQRTIDRFWSEKLSWNLKLRWAKNRREQIMNNHLSIEYWLCIYNMYTQGQFSIYFISAHCHQWAILLLSIQIKRFKC